MTVLSDVPYDLMRRFCMTKGYQRLARMDEAGSYMHVHDPTGLAVFVAYCSGRRRIYLRGGTKKYPHSIPSLFRGPDDRQYDYHGCERRWRAYKDLLTRLRPMLNGRRWRRPGLGAVLQHYGLKTPWLDVVRNFYTAIWFATSDKETENQRKVDGWISLYVNERRKLKVIDIWGEHSSKHFRPHVQQGLSLAMQPDDAHAPCEQQDFDRYRIALIRFRRSAEWNLGAHMFSRRFLFPNRTRDDSLRQLCRERVDDAVIATCRNHGLDDGALGRVEECSD